MITRGMYNLDLLSRGMYGREAVIVVGRFTLLRHAVEVSAGGYLLKVDVTKAVGVDREIFVHRLSRGSVDQTRQALFSHVASPSDLNEYPVDVPVAPGFYYREWSASLVFRSLPLLHESWLALGRDIQGLAEALDKFQDVEVTTRKIA